jgi:hypothetical protein
MTMTLITTQTLEQDTAVLDLISIPQNFTDLIFLISARISSSSTTPLMFMRINDLGFVNRSGVRLQGNGSTVTTQLVPDNRIANVTGALVTSNTFNNAVVHFPNYSGNSAKTFSCDSVTENNATEAAQSFVAGSWNDTAAINRITFNLPVAVNFVTGTTVSVYGVTKGSDGTTTVS